MLKKILSVTLAVAMMAALTLSASATSVDTAPATRDEIRDRAPAPQYVHDIPQPITLDPPVFYDDSAVEALCARIKELTGVTPAFISSYDTETNVITSRIALDELYEQTDWFLTHLPHAEGDVELPDIGIDETDETAEKVDIAPAPAPVPSPVHTDTNDKLWYRTNDGMLHWCHVGVVPEHSNFIYPTYEKTEVENKVLEPKSANEALKMIRDFIRGKSGCWADCAFVYDCATGRYTLGIEIYTDVGYDCAHDYSEPCCG